ncbi:MAG: hypothetical protein R6W68_13835 [Ignavibacteriaceae bacterium]
MIPELRTTFNENFSEEIYNNFLNELDNTLKYPTDFRVCETPLFMDDTFTKSLYEACNDIVEQVNEESFLEKSNEAIPSHLFVPNETKIPHFLQIDFAVAVEDGKLLPKLIELQAFPSLYGYQSYFDKILRKYFQIPENFSAYFSGYDEEKYKQLLKQIIIDDADPENVVLLEIHPEQQKTRIDFAATENLIGIKTVCLTKVFKKGTKLFYSENGKDIPIERIYNRVIFDELDRKGLKFNFDFRDDIDVYWISHPNWFFKISKFSLPQLTGRFVPECYFLSEIKDYPDDLQNFVLKPLFSFAGIGVEVEVTKDKLNSIGNKVNYIIQRKINYAPLIQTPDGFSKAEIRMMYLWKDKLVLVNNLIRTSKGKMMGVDFNKNKTWVGSSIAYHRV